MLVFCKFLELIYCSSFLRLFPLPGVVSSQNIYWSVLSKIQSPACLQCPLSDLLVSPALCPMDSSHLGPERHCFNSRWPSACLASPPYPAASCIILPECFTPDFSCGICRVHLIYFLNLTSRILCLPIMWSIVSCIFAWLFHCCILEVNLITVTSSSLKVEVRTWNFIQSVV